MRSFAIVMSALVAISFSQAARAENGDYSGRWLFSGLLLQGRQAMSFAQICDLTQTATQIAGTCRGPNGGCSLVGILNGNDIDLTCRLAVPNNPSIAGTLTFHGALAPDGILRGSYTHSRAPGAKGQASLMRI